MARLPIDSSLFGYWGFDEANVGDPALDESTYNNPLTVTAASSVVPARVGNGRQFDGTNTIAAPADSALFRTLGASATLIGWITLDSVNQAGDLLRPITTLLGPGTALADAGFGLYVENTGAVVYRYFSSTNQDCLLRSAASTIRTSRYYSIVLVQTPGAGGGMVARLYLNNTSVSWVSLSVDGVVQGGDPNGEGLVPASVGVNAVLNVGGSARNSSRWHGVIDELSIHNVARSYSPYLKAAYFSVTQNLSFNRLTTIGTVRTVGSVETGGGSRWWCYERDGGLYVIRESSPGLFSQEVLLTTGGATPQGAAYPAGIEQPRLSYDEANDTLLVIFVSGARVFKVTALGTDSPTTQNMPVTSDTNNIVKVRDFTEYFRAGYGGSDAGHRLEGLWDNSSGVGLMFLTVPTFGLAILSSSAYGFAVYKYVGGEMTLYAIQRTPQTVRPYAGTYFWVPIPSRVYGVSYAVKFFDSAGRVLNAISLSPMDALGQAYITGAGNIHVDADALQEVLQACGAGPDIEKSQWFGFSAVRPIKIPPIIENFTTYAHAMDFEKSAWFSIVSTVPIKMAMDAGSFSTVGAGDRLGVNINVWGTWYYV